MIENKVKWAHNRKRYENKQSIENVALGYDIERREVKIYVWFCRLLQYRFF